jgi:hypothetical protein
MKQLAIKYGLATGLMIGLWNVLMFTVSSWIVSKCNIDLPAYTVRQLVGLFSVLMLIVGIWLALRGKRRENNNQLSYKEAIFTGVKMSMVVAVLVSLYSLAYCEILNPDFAMDMTKEVEKALKASGASPGEIAEKLKQAQTEFSTPAQVMMALVGQTVIGTIGSLIIGFFIRTKRTNI